MHVFVIATYFHYLYIMNTPWHMSSSAKSNTTDGGYIPLGAINRAINHATNTKHIVKIIEVYCMYNIPTLL
jgi:hypothetical protein